MTQIQTRIIPVHEVCYKEDSNWGLYGCEVEDDKKKFKLNSFGNITVTGIMPQLQLGVTYEAVLEEVNNKKYGYQYKVTRVYQDITTVDGQKEFLQAILPSSQFKSLWDVYGGQDIVKLVQEDKIDISKVKGVGKKTYAKIKKKILDNLYLQQALVELSAYQLTYKTIKRLVDQYGSPQLALEKVKEDPYVLTELDGFGFKKVDSIALSTGIEKDSPYRIRSAITHVLKTQASNYGHCWIEKDLLITETAKLTNLPRSIIEPVLTDENMTNHLHIEKNRIGLRKYYNYEKVIYEKILELTEVDPWEVSNVDEKIKMTEQEQGFAFTDEQRLAIQTIAKENVMILDGRAGSGKSTTLRGVVSVFKDYRIAQTALAGKAARRMEQASGIEAHTIHRLLGWNPESGFEFDDKNPLPYDIVIIDECSMIDGWLMHCLLRAIQAGTKVLFLGDIEQLPAIGASQIFKDLIDSRKLPHVSLTKIQRQAADSGILSVANTVRDGKIYGNLDTKRVFGKNKDFFHRPHETEEQVFMDIIELCKQYVGNRNNGNPDDIQVIVPMKSRGLVCAEKLNKALQDIFNPHDGLSPVITVGNTEYRIGDRVMQMVNNYSNPDAPIMNGNIGKIIDITINKDEKTMTIDFGENGIAEYNTIEEFYNIGHAWCSTVHKLQGSESPIVIIGLTDSAYVLLSRQLLYTAITRGKEKVILCCQPSAVVKSVRTNVSGNRKTYLPDFFGEAIK